MSAAPFALSRLPVGSSARRIAGPPTSARAIAARCSSPPESSFVRCSARDDREDERQRHVVDDAIARKQVERLEHHPHPLGAMTCQAGLIQSREVLAVDADPPGRGPLKARDDVKERRLS